MAAPTQQQGAVKTALADIVRGTVGGISLTIVGHPFDTIKVRLQTQPAGNTLYSSALDCVRKTYQWEGLRGFYKGVASPLAGQMAFVSVNLIRHMHKHLPIHSRT